MGDTVQLFPSYSKLFTLGQLSRLWPWVFLGLWSGKGKVWSPHGSYEGRTCLRTTRCYENSTSGHSSSLTMCLIHIDISCSNTVLGTWETRYMGEWNKVGEGMKWSRERKSKEPIFVGCWPSDGKAETRIRLVLSYKARLEISLLCEFAHLSFFNLIFIFFSRL